MPRFRQIQTEGRFIARQRQTGWKTAENGNKAACDDHSQAASISLSLEVFSLPHRLTTEHTEGTEKNVFSVLSVPLWLNAVIVFAM